MQQGTVTWFNEGRGFGFIEETIFVHYTQIAGEGFRTLEEGQVVQFELRKGPKGEYAENVTPAQ